MKTFRLFVALPISEEIRESLKRLQAAGCETDFPARWVSPEGMHLTLVFLGWTDPALQSKIEERVDKAARATSPFSLHVKGLGTFPKPQAPKIIWAGVEEAVDLIALQRRLSIGMADLGFESESRPYRPHLTLGRGEALPDKKTLNLFNEWVVAGKDLEIGKCQIEEVVLMKSEAQPGGSRYKNLYAAKLRG